MPTATLLPIAITSSNDWTGGLADMDEGVDAADGAFGYTDTPGHVRCSFQAPPANLTIGAGLQTFRLRARRQGAATQFSMYLYESTTQKALLLSQQSLTSSFILYTSTWNASLLDDVSGVNVQVQFNRNSGDDFQIDAFDWIANYTAPSMAIPPLLSTAQLSMLAR